MSEFLVVSVGFVAYSVAWAWLGYTLGTAVERDRHK